MSAWSTSSCAPALTHWSDWLDCLFNYKVCFMTCFAARNVRHLQKLICEFKFVLWQLCVPWWNFGERPVRSLDSSTKVLYNCSCDTVVTINMMKNFSSYAAVSQVVFMAHCTSLVAGCVHYGQTSPAISMIHRVGFKPHTSTDADWKHFSSTFKIKWMHFSVFVIHQIPAYLAEVISSLDVIQK